MALHAAVRASYHKEISFKHITLIRAGRSSRNPVLNPVGLAATCPTKSGSSCYTSITPKASESHFEWTLVCVQHQVCVRYFYKPCPLLLSVRGDHLLTRSLTLQVWEVPAPLEMALHAACQASQTKKTSISLICPKRLCLVGRPSRNPVFNPVGLAATCPTGSGSSCCG